MVNRILFIKIKPVEIQAFFFILFIFMQDNLRNYVRCFLKESLADERYLDKLANLILKHIATKLLERDGSLVYKQQDENTYQVYPGDFDIYKYTLDLDGFPENIKNLIERQGLRIFLSLQEDGDTKGSYATPRTIYLYYNPKDSYLKDIWELINGKYIGIGSTSPIKANSTDVYVKLFYLFHSTLLHELRHAFDDFRSKRKYLNTKRWEKHQKKVLSLSPFNPESEESIQQHSAKNVSYLRLAHEINARFSQAMAKVRFDKYSDDWETKYKKPFDEVYKDFKYEFENWRNLTPKMQQWITKRLYKYWDEHETQQEN